MSITTSRRIAAHYIYSRRSLQRNPILSLSSDGTVTGIELCDEPDRREEVEFYPGILIPSMVNAHCHLELSYLRGRIAGGGGFVAFADGLGAVRNAFPEEERIKAAAAADEAMWRSGVGAVADICNGATTFGLKRGHILNEAAGIYPGDSRAGNTLRCEPKGSGILPGYSTEGRGIFYKNFLELFGLGAGSAEPLAPVAQAVLNAGLDWSVTPHSTYSLNTAGFAAAVRGIDGQTGGCRAPLSIHFMESAAEEGLYEGRGEMAEWYARRGMEIDFGRFGSPARRIIAQISPERDIMLIHNCFVTEDVVDMIEGHFTGRVTWVLCPRSNRYISRIEPPYQMLRRKGVRIAVGTDSLSSNWSLDMLEELKIFRGVPLEELLGWAVDNGAEALGVDHELGGFEVGKRTGAVLLTGVDWDSMTFTPGARTERIA